MFLGRTVVAIIEILGNMFIRHTPHAFLPKRGQTALKKRQI